MKPDIWDMKYVKFKYSALKKDPQKSLNKGISSNVEKSKSSLILKLITELEFKVEVIKP